MFREWCWTISVNIFYFNLSYKFSLIYLYDKMLDIAWLWSLQRFCIKRPQDHKTKLLLLDSLFFGGCIEWHISF